MPMGFALGYIPNDACIGPCSTPTLLGTSNDAPREEMTAERMYEVLKKVAEKSVKNGTWPMLLATLALTIGFPDEEK